MKRIAIIEDDIVIRETGKNVIHRRFAVFFQVGQKGIFHGGKFRLPRIRSHQPIPRVSCEIPGLYHQL